MRVGYTLRDFPKEQGALWAFYLWIGYTIEMLWLSFVLLEPPGVETSSRARSNSQSAWDADTYTTDMTDWLTCSHTFWTHKVLLYLTGQVTWFPAISNCLRCLIACDFKLVQWSWEVWKHTLRPTNKHIEWLSVLEDISRLLVNPHNGAVLI